MLVVLPVCHSDFDRGIELVRWMGELGSYPNHQALIVAGKFLEVKHVLAISEELRNSGFRQVSAIKLHEEDPRPWPFNPNRMFSIAANHICSTNLDSSYLWLETDAIPLKKGWLDALESEYDKVGKDYMGAVFSQPWTHMVGVAIYPGKLPQINPYCLSADKLPFDTVRPDLTLSRAHVTDLICHAWGDVPTNTPWTFPDLQSMNRIPEPAVLFHRSKDLTLIHRLREQLHPAVEPGSLALSVEPTKQQSNGSRIDLGRVTLWSACWNENAEMVGRTMRVLRYCSEKFNFARILLFTHIPIPVVPDFPLDVVQIPKLEMPNGWNIFVNRVVPLAINTDFAMSVHEDGFPIHPELWSQKFLEYDYIGAPWQDGVVGNGGFNIESQKLLKAKMNLPLYDRTIPSDYYVCRIHRNRLEQEGIRFAPKEVALSFSAETVRGPGPAFGFHSRKYNETDYRNGWSIIERLEENTSVKVVVVYIYLSDPPACADQARAFVNSYKQFPPRYRHRTVVVCQNIPPTDESKAIFDSLPDVSFVVHDNSGHDIGAFISVAGKSKDDIMVCLGSSTSFRRSGWLARMVQACRKHGPGVYGSNATYEVSPHLNTTGFWCDPRTLAAYPIKVVTKRHRYDFEHGPNAFWKWAASKGWPVKLVTWCGEYDWPMWRQPANIFRRGDQSNCLTFWHHHEKYVAAGPALKATMERNSDIITDPLYLAVTGRRGGIISKMLDAGKTRKLQQKSADSFIRAHSNFV